MNIYERTFSGMVRTRTGFNFKIWREDLASGAYAERLRADPLAELWRIEHVDSFIALEHIGGTIMLDAGDRVALLLGDVDVVAAVAHQIARLKAWTMTHISGEADFFAAAAPLAIALGYDVDADREHRGPDLSSANSRRRIYRRACYQMRRWSAMTSVPVSSTSTWALARSSRLTAQISPAVEFASATASRACV